MIVIIEKNKDGKIELTEEELKKLLEQAKQEGRDEKTYYIAPTAPTPQLTPAPNWITPTPVMCNGYINSTAIDSKDCKGITAINGTNITKGLTNE